LEPTKSLFDENGNLLDPLEIEIDTLYKALTNQKIERTKIKP
jgi:hypothetical protein